MVEIKEVIQPGDLKQFVDFPFALYRGNAFWVPPIRLDEMKQLRPQTNPSFRYSDVKFWTAWEQKRCVGRIGALINHDHNRKTNSRFGRITRVEFIDRTDVSDRLFEVAENWLKDQGMMSVHGPLGFNNLDNQGLLIEGYNYLPSIASVYHYPYYHEHFSRLGYSKENDWIEFRLTLGEAAVSKAIRGAEIVKKRFGFTVKSFTSSREMQSFAGRVFHMMNQAFHDLPYVTAFDDEMIGYIAKKYFKILDPRFVKLVMKGEEIAAFIICIPSLSAAMQKANGKLIPFGFYHLLKAMKHPEVIDLLLTGVAPEYHSSGAAVILFAEIQAEMARLGITQMETTGIFETNHSVIANWKNYEHIQHKRRRCFRKDL